MLESDLQTGDILFFMDASGQPCHVAIYQGFRADTHFITHAVSAPYHCIMTTRLKADHYPYRVFRSTDMALGMLAACRMRIWAENKIPFSEEKHSLYEAICDQFSHPRTGGSEQCSYAMRYFPVNFYRYIEMAAHPELPYFPHAENPQGMYCSESLTAAINVENLLMIGAVSSCKDMNVSWVTDSVKPELIRQYIESLPKDKQPSERYFEYVMSSHSEHEYSLGSLSDNLREETAPFLPSFLAWRYDRYDSIEGFSLHYPHPLPLDSKVSTPWAMLQYFENNPEKWQNCGELVVQPIVYPLENLEANKAAWQSYVSTLFEKALEMHEQVRLGISKISLDSIKVEPFSPSKRIKKTRSVEDLKTLLNSPGTELSQTAAREKMKPILIFTSPTGPKPVLPIPREKLKRSARRLFPIDDKRLLEDIEFLSTSSASSSASSSAATDDTAALTAFRRNR